MTDAEQKRLLDLTWKYVGGKTAPDPSTLQWAWQQVGVPLAAAANARNPDAKVSPWDMLEKWAKGKTAGGSGSGGGAGGGASSSSTTSRSTQRNVQKVSESQAKGLLTQALQALNGRSYSAAEVTDFVNKFNAEAAANPQVSSSVTHTVSRSSGGTNSQNTSSSSTSSTSSGGVDPTQVATDYAKSRPDWAEYQTAVPLMNAFMSAIGNPTQGGF
jgi:hypothetical protein